MKALDTRLFRLILVVMILMLIIWLMSILQCEMAPPAY
jgi:hypothetical protein